MPTPIAAIDVGSNSVRVAVMSLSDRGVLDVLEEARAVPRLIRDVEEHGEFLPATMDALLSVLGDFRLLADAAGAEIVAVATSAARDAANGAMLVQRVREELGFDLRIISGEEEARYAFLGATCTLPVSDGFVLDIGGGSMEVVRFEARRVVDSWTLPLGAVRLTDRFLTSDPLQTSELRSLRTHIAHEVRAAGMPTLTDGAVLVGTGGTIRNLGKIDRSRRSYPLTRLHGYEVGRDDMRRVSDLVQLRSVAERRTISGLNEDRADTIVAGGLVVEAMMTALEAPSIVVSGQGLREGMAIDRALPVPPTLDELRSAAVDAIVDRFTPARRSIARQRRAITEGLARAVGASIGPDVLDALSAAAAVQDIGRSVDYYNRERHTELLLLEHGLDGWSHRELALVCALVRQAHQDRYTPANYRPLITPRDHEAIAAAGAVLALADALALRSRESRRHDFRWRRANDRLLILDDDLRLGGLSGPVGRFQRTFGVQIDVERATGR